jgi:hypothetical protein
LRGTTSWSRRVPQCWPRPTPVRSRPSVSWAKPSGWFGPGRADSGAPRPGGGEKIPLLLPRIGTSQSQQVPDQTRAGQEWRDKDAAISPQDRSGEISRKSLGSAGPKVFRQVSSRIFLRIDSCVQKLSRHTPDRLRPSGVLSTKRLPGRLLRLAHCPVAVHSDPLRMP